MNIVTLPPGTIMTRSGETSAPKPAVQILRHRLAQRRNPRRVGIAVLAVAQSLDGRLDDMGRRFEVGLADAEIDDVAPLALQFSRSRQHREGVFLADALKGGLDGGHSDCVSGGGALLLAKSRPSGKGVDRSSLTSVPRAATGEQGSSARRRPPREN